MKTFLAALTISFAILAYCDATAAEPIINPNKCRYQGKNYPFGASWSPDGCNKCDCIRKANGVNAVAVCTTISCSRMDGIVPAEDCPKGSIKAGGKQFSIDCEDIKEIIQPPDSASRENNLRDTDSAPGSNGGDLK
jgi:hypothetical protein